MATRRSGLLVQPVFLEKTWRTLQCLSEEPSLGFVPFYCLSLELLDQIPVQKQDSI